MPRLSLTMKTGSVIQWYKKEGDAIKKGEPVVEVLSEKVTYDVEGPITGVLRKILVMEGYDVPVGATLAFITAPNERLPKTEIKPLEQPSESIKREEGARENAKLVMFRKRVLASPAAKRLAREYKMDLTQIQGSGFEGRIVEQDVTRLMEEKARMSPSVKREFPLTGIRKISAERVTSSFRTAPHSFIIMNVDATEAVKLREKIKVSYTAILIYAVARALHEHRMINSTLLAGKIRLYSDINIGIAISTEKGLVVPVIHNADEKQLLKISSELEELVDIARQGKLSKEQLACGTFTVTNLGMHDVNVFLPIINPPEAAILAAGRTVKKPVVADDKIVIKPVMTLTLAYDHRIVDGAPASLFLKKIKDIIEEHLPF